MRMRRKKNGEQRLAACGELVLTGDIKDPKEIFGNGNPVHLEIGCGKGDFICGMAEANPDINFIAIERISDVLMLAAEKVKLRGYKNVRLAVMNAAQLGERFAPGSISRIYLNFSDPWPKKGYAKRRLTYRAFLDIYKTVLTENGSVFLKTDDLNLFDFSIEELTASGFVITDMTRDLHQSEYSEGNVMTEYERNFVSEGKKINMLRARLKGDNE
ncbi:MAG: tRNA (guanosine(46)-N7)-methyltransferase TrmB [Clostridia bacterium]|nr:tRNA (guanosine(46)-N7)-methyltransferase TrmB [Clostridia bacterium]